MYSGVIAWLFRCLLGITPLEERAGFEQIELQPTFLADVGYAKGNMQTVRGRIDAEWHKVDDGFVYTVILPDGILATFQGKELKKGKNEFHIKQETTK